MKKAVILHAVEMDSGGHWYPWLKKQLEQRGYDVWVPDLPQPDHPDDKLYIKFLLESGWDFADNLIIGHSSGAVMILHLLQNLPADIKIKTGVLAGSFSRILWPNLHKDLFTVPFDFEKIKAKAKNLVFMHGDNDPWCPPKEAAELAKKSGGEFILVPGGGHFSTSLDPKYTEFPELISILEERNLL